LALSTVMMVRSSYVSLSTITCRNSTSTACATPARLLSSLLTVEWLLA
jgi:hypothetical protein